MQDLPKVHRNFFSRAIIWGSLHSTEENILLLRNIDIYNYTPVALWQESSSTKVEWAFDPASLFLLSPASALMLGPYTDRSELD